MRKFLKASAVVLGAVVFVVVAAIIYDRLILARHCPPCHTEETRKLPMFGPEHQDGIVQVRSNGRLFRARVAGFENAGGDGVVLLHGYPATSIMWTPVIHTLAKNGFRVIAFDQRGYSPGARPGRVKSYSKDNLVGDAIGIANAVGFERFHIVGHDWGGVIAWLAADRHPDRVATVTSLATPHPEALREALLGSLEQLKSSSYALLTFIPGVGEFIFGFNQAAYLKRYSWNMMSAPVRDEYERVFTEPGALSAALKWYRANSFFSGAVVAKTRQPTLYIWGNQDRSLSREGAEKTADYVKGPYKLVKMIAAHRLVTEFPDRVSQEILSHLTRWPIAVLPPLPPVSSGAVGEQKCAGSKPRCLRLNVAPNGTAIQIINKCEQRHAGTIILRCNKWPDEAYTLHEFDLGPASKTVYVTHGLSFGECYYNQTICIAPHSSSPR